MSEYVVLDESSNETEWQVNVRKEVERMESSLDFSTENEIEEVDIRYELDHFSMRKAPGCDRMTVRMVKEGWSWIREDIHWIFNDSIRSGYFPNRWKVGELNMLPKGGDKDPTRSVHGGQFACCPC